jgi:hypothetical protein
MITWLRWLVVAALLVACATSTPTVPSPPENHADRTPMATATASDELVAMVLTEYIADPKSLPDGQLIAATAAIPVVVDVSNGPPPTLSRLPRGARPFEFTTLDELRKQADVTSKQIGYLHISIEIESPTSAQVERGTDIALPTNPAVVKLCCCSTSRRYDRTPTGWKLHGNIAITSCG